jgi:hypothetical protein
MHEYVGNYSVPTANGNLKGVDTPVGTGILNFINIYIRQTPVNVAYYSIDNSQFWCRVSSVVPK